MSNNPQWEGKPHLVLDWFFDIPNQRLSCKIGDDLEYIAHQGGYSGYTKRLKNSSGVWEESTISTDVWHQTEKTWISENYGEIVGYFQYDADRMVINPTRKQPEHAANGIGPDGRYIDHMQRMQILLEGEDMALIDYSKINTRFSTPDCGKTIYKRISTRNVFYTDLTNPTAWWSEHSQPCMMQPFTPGVRLSSYQEMLDEGIDESIVEICKQGQWHSPKHPELQQWYIYPKL